MGSDYTGGWCPLQGLALSTFQVVLVPTILGVLTNEFFPNIVKMLKPILPLIGVALTTLLCASPCAQVAEILRCASLNLERPFLEDASDWRSNPM